MESLYQAAVLQQVLSRVDQLTPSSQPIWGKMNVVQMMEHCARTFDFSTGKTKPKRAFIGLLIGSFFRSMYSNDKPWGKNSPTSPQYRVADELSFNETKTRLVNLISEFSLGGPEKCTTHPSPFFGKLTPEEHGKGQYKHLDHHLQQFGV